MWITVYTTEDVTNTTTVSRVNGDQTLHNQTSNKDTSAKCNPTKFTKIWYEKSEVYQYENINYIPSIVIIFEGNSHLMLLFHLQLPEGSGFIFSYAIMQGVSCRTRYFLEVATGSRSCDSFWEGRWYN